MRRALLAGILAAVLVLAAERVHGAFAWLACAPLGAASAASAARCGRGRRWLEGLVAGSAFALAVALVGESPWLTAVGRSYFGLSNARATVAASALAAGCAAWAGPVLGVALWRAAALPGALAVVGAAAIWSAWEGLLVIAPPSYPWVSLAATQTDTPAAAQAASLGGAALVSYLVALSGFAVGRALVARGPARAAGLAAAAAVALVTVVAGAWRLGSAGDRGGPPASVGAPVGGECRIAAVDASIEPAAADLDSTAARYADASERARARAPSLIVWPESALVRDPRLDGELRGRLQAWSRAWGAALLVGAPRFGWSADWVQQRFNAMVLVSGDAPLAAYDKRRPVPFAESWPIPWLARPSWLAVDDVTAGERAGLVEARSCRVGVLVCFEAERPELARELAAGGAAALVVATNDAQLPPVAVAREVAQARLRALETGLPVLRAANRGESVAIDRFGRIAARAHDGITELTPTSAEPAPAVAWQGMAWAAIAIAAAVSFAGAGRR
ncbi:MAG TPA: apolipoprotein N-acyltransferase [Candidatus Binatia bacterium]|nr:apolipoprotein N-acyltransferase [Candidatus Binatia bacterium]